MRKLGGIIPEFWAYRHKWRSRNGWLPLVFALLAAMISSVVQAQRYNFHHYGVEDGLPQDQVWAVTRDSAGYLWAGTYSGVFRYNGHAFRTYTIADGLGGNVVEAISVDDSGVVWAGTGAGACRLDREADRFHCLPHPLLATAYVYALHPVDTDLWIGTDRGLFHVRNDKVVKIYGDSSGLPSSDIRSIEADANGNLWIGTTQGLAHFNPGEDEFYTPSFPDAQPRQVLSLLSGPEHLWIGTDDGLFVKHAQSIEIPDNTPTIASRVNITGIARSQDNRLWLTTNEGVLVKQNGQFQHLTEVNGLRNNISYCVLADDEGLVWIGQDSGLTKWVPSAFLGYTPDNGLLQPFVRTINEDSRNRLWLGTRGGVQVVPYQGGKWQFDRSWTITAADGLQDERTYSILFPEPGAALIATSKGMVLWHKDEGITRVYTERDGLQDNRIQTLFQDHEGRIWIGTNLGTAILEDGDIRPADNPTLSKAYVYRIRQDHAGRMWFATKNRGLLIRSGDGVKRLDDDGGLSDRTLWDITSDGKGGMWVGSNGDGLFHVTEDLTINRYTTNDGLANNFVWQILVDSRSNVWAYTNQGLSRLTDEKFTNFDRHDGLLHEEGGATGAWESHDGQLWFASAEGLMRYDPEIDFPGQPAPRVVIERVALGGSSIEREAEIPYQSGGLDISFAGLSFWAESETRFRYRLIGVSDKWSDPIPNRPITFGSLGAGNHTFEVEARGLDGNWSEKPAQFTFSVARPYWQTVWFWSLTVLATAILFWSGLRYKTRQSEAHRRKLETLVRERTRELETVNAKFMEANEKLKDISRKDPLTGLLNRRFLVDQAPRDVAQSYRAYMAPSTFPNRDVVFMMIDLDHFKDINDTYGHFAGDEVLQAYAQIIKRRLRDSDYVVRWGGEEFLVVARQTEASQCNVIAERIISDAREARFEVENGKEPISCTCSIGVCHFPFDPKHPNALNWEQIVDIADHAVYMAKKLGRNGWVAIHGTSKVQITDSEEFLRRFKNDYLSLVENNEIMLECSFDKPPAATELNPDQQ